MTHTQLHDVRVGAKVRKHKVKFTEIPKTEEAKKSMGQEEEKPVGKTFDELVAEKIEKDDFRDFGMPGLTQNPVIAHRVVKGDPLTEPETEEVEKAQPGSAQFKTEQSFEVGAAGEEKTRIGANGTEDFPTREKTEKKRKELNKEEVDGGVQTRVEEEVKVDKSLEEDEVEKASEKKMEGVKVKRQPGSKKFVEDQPAKFGGGTQKTTTVGATVNEGEGEGGWHGHGEKKKKSKKKKASPGAIMEHESSSATMGGAGQKKTKFKASGDRRLVNKGLVKAAESLQKAVAVDEDLAKSQDGLDGVKMGKSRKKPEDEKK
jgi:hypothetical protein